MVTDILEQGHASCWCPATRRASSARSAQRDDDGVIDLPGVMSRKKQVAPRLLAIF